MATNFPTSLDTLTNPTSSDSLSSPSHSAQHANVNDAVEALQAKVGVNGSAVTTSLDYKVANQGLTLVKTQTIGSGVSSVTVTGAFSSTFENYRVLLSNSDASSNGTEVRMTLGSASTNYYWTGISTTLSTGPTRVSGNNVAYWAICTSDAANATSAVVDIFAPNLAQRTGYLSKGTYVIVYDVGGFLSDTTQYTSLTVSIASGTLSGGTIRVYGYNNG